MTKASRRQLLLWATGLILLPNISALAERLLFAPLAELPPIPKKFSSLAAEPPMSGEFANVLANQGTGTPDDEEVKTAKAIISAAPTHVDPVEVAGFFLDVASGAFDSEWRAYTRAWPRDAPANPLILAFFSQTNTKPAGDNVAWCAAFLNWCLRKSAFGVPIATGSPPTDSASSGSFRDWGRAYASYDPVTNSLVGALTPKVGDIAVFQEMINGQADPHRGHVAFFLAMADTHVMVLGDNQFEGDPVVHAINVKNLPKQGALQLHSIRSDPSRASIDDILNTARVAVVRIEVSGTTTSNQEFDTIGSGVVITPDGYVITAAHLIPDNLTSKTIKGTLGLYQSPDEGKAQVEDLSVVKIDHGLDIALLKLAQLPEGMRPLPINPVLPRRTVTFYVLGFAAGSSYMTRDDVIYQADPATREEHRFEYHGIVNPGNSGSPILDENGYIVGIHLAVEKVVNNVRVGGIYEGVQSFDFPLPDNWNVKRVRPLFMPNSDIRENLSWRNHNASDLGEHQIRQLLDTYFLGDKIIYCGIQVNKDWVTQSVQGGFMITPPLQTTLSNDNLELSFMNVTDPKFQAGDDTATYEPAAFGVPGSDESILLSRFEADDPNADPSWPVPFRLKITNDKYFVEKLLWRSYNLSDQSQKHFNAARFMCSVDRSASLALLLTICEDFAKQALLYYGSKDNDCVPGSSE